MSDPHTKLRRDADLRRPPQPDNNNNSAAALRDALVPTMTTISSNQPPMAALRCCCGKTGCIFLEHNCSVLESVEKDVQTAAKLGQSLLERHEAYMADAERDRAELFDRIDKLEMDKQELEAENARKIEENRALLDQLESLNTSVADSDTRIQMLEATLQSTQQIIRRLEGADERAEDMERHLAALETEQALLQSNLITSESEAKSAVQRWRQAERGIADLQYQLEKMEKETREDRERHMEIMGRVERQRAAERALNTAAGRLKGAAAAKSLQDRNNGGGGSGVISHFVRDLLQDNASLQMGMAELRDMLMNSNDEIQALRDQLMFHQPLAEAEASAASTLRAELGTDTLPEPSADILELPQTPSSHSVMAPATPASRHTPSSSQELHIHHHYHVANGKKAEVKRTKKKRLSLTPSVFTPPITVPTTPLSRSQSVYYQDIASSAPGTGSPSSRRALSRHLSRDSTSTVPSNRWSVFSDQPSEMAMSSVPSSPRTNPRNSIFDRSGLSEFSLPASPTTSVDPMSPPWRASSHISSLDASAVCGFPPPLNLSTSIDQTQPPHPIIEVDESTPTTIPAEAESGMSSAGDIPDLASNTTSADESLVADTATPTPTMETSVQSLDTVATAVKDDMPLFARAGTHRPLHRAVSHESIISLHGGLDIHTLKSRPSQLMLQPLGTSLADIGLSSITARPVMSKAGTGLPKSHALLRDRLAQRMPPSKANASPLASASLSSIQATATPTAPARRFGRFAAWRPWGGSSSTPAPVAEEAEDEPSTDVLPALGTDVAVIGSVTNSTCNTASAVPESDIPTSESHVAADSNAEVAIAAAAALKNASAKVQSKQIAVTKAKVLSERDVLRSPGINQPGAIPGFMEYWAAHQLRGAPSQIHADGIDHEALREGLLDI